MRSDCPLNFGLEIFGDKWTLLIIRDMMFFNKRYYNEFLMSKEGISTNILADRLAMLERERFITKQKDGKHKQKIIYSLTEKGIDLLPVIIEVGLWSDKYASDDLNPGKEIILGGVKENKMTGLEKIREKLYTQHIKE
ncbi:winged helix-turn-helix transcriptional regulator [Pararcticibacter amylolyticus]|uniref:Transcriptional regulator n=1 Tax=Pararcticibacter amylolyticus TaxID=2173175 RepID=A0A2U2PG14_9SPHI|nr:helix-turn-helix domain-containing protein [Pararcticibacter amylolyticus]PWG80347.1 transcriptional regulator [Pararcticibacter amylolyticus]